MKVYSEKIHFSLFYYLFFLFIAITIYFAYVYSLQNLEGITLAEQAPAWFNLSMSVFFGIFTFIIYQFKYLEIAITSDNLLVRYGLFLKKIPRTGIDDAYLDRANALWAYGGWGIRFGKYQQKRRHVYNLPGKPCVVVSIRNTNKEFVFSTDKPDQIIQLLKASS